MDSNLRHPGRREGEGLVTYYLRVNHGIDRRSPLDRLMQDEGLTYQEACEVEFGHLFKFDDWVDFARHRYEIGKADKDIGFTIESITATVNLAFNMNLSIDEVYRAVNPSRQDKMREYKARYREKNRERLAAIERERYHRIKESK